MAPRSPGRGATHHAPVIASEAKQFGPSSAAALAIDHATKSKSLFASFSSEKEDSS
jgi:hypothetical protein